LGLEHAQKVQIQKLQNKIKILNLILNNQMNRIHENIPALSPLPNTRNSKQSYICPYCARMGGREEGRKECSTTTALS
jgi:hypothetical protein